MASVIYPYPNNGHKRNPTQIKKEVCLMNDVVARFPDGYIIAKGNIIEGIEAKE